VSVRGSTADHELLTHSGQVVDLRQPDPVTIRLEDIANGLASTIRYRGALGVQLTVAQHCVMLSYWIDMEPSRRVWALFHDAAEAYLGDMSAPAKRLPGTAGFFVAEQRLLETIAVKYGLEGTRCPDSVMAADKAIRAYEVDRYGDNSAWAELALDEPAKWLRWWGPIPASSPFYRAWKRPLWSPAMARYMWLLRAKQLGVAEVT
jgi:hypothetical protein